MIGLPATPDRCLRCPAISPGIARRHAAACCGTAAAHYGRAGPRQGAGIGGVLIDRFDSSGRCSAIRDLFASVRGATMGMLTLLMAFVERCWKSPGCHPSCRRPCRRRHPSCPPIDCFDYRCSCCCRASASLNAPLPALQTGVAAMLKKLKLSCCLVLFLTINCPSLSFFAINFTSMSPPLFLPRV